MKKLCIVLSALLMANAAVAKSHLFKPYDVTIANHSGGIAKIKFDKHIRTSTGTNVIEDRKSMMVRILSNDAKAHFHAGPEDAKGAYSVQFCAPTGAAKTLILSAKSAVATGFETKCSSYSVEVENISGGQVTVMRSDDMSLKPGSRIADHKTVKATVRPGSSMIVKSGPESKKHEARITFGVKTGTPAKVTLHKPGILSGCATAHGVVLQAKHAPQARRKFERPERKIVTNKEKMRRGTAQ